MWHLLTVNNCCQKYAHRIGPMPENESAFNCNAWLPPSGLLGAPKVSSVIFRGWVHFGRFVCLQALGQTFVSKELLVFNVDLADVVV